MFFCRTEKFRNIKFFNGRIGNGKELKQYKTIFLRILENDSLKLDIFTWMEQIDPSVPPNRFFLK